MFKTSPEVAVRSASKDEVQGVVANVSWLPNSNVFDLESADRFSVPSHAMAEWLGFIDRRFQIGHFEGQSWQD